MVMPIEYLQVSVFTKEPGAGNPAAVCELEAWPTDEQLSNIAKKIGLPVTAFIVRRPDLIELQWLTRSGSRVESMCGHGSFAAAYAVSEKSPTLLGFDFESPGGLVHVDRSGDAFRLTLPRWDAKHIETPPGLAEALRAVPKETLDAGRDLISIFAREDDVRSLKPDMKALLRLGHRGFIATSKGREYDCVSRFFCPSFGLGFDEDPVTGSAHCSIAPLWAERLSKSRIRAYQASNIGGELLCDVSSSSVVITANAVLWKKSHTFV